MIGWLAIIFLLFNFRVPEKPAQPQNNITKPAYPRTPVPGTTHEHAAPEEPVECGLQVADTPAPQAKPGERVFEPVKYKSPKYH
ncbi:MAG: hypothetical protein LUD51_00280 [Clostridia bacterium]|nr:hypothetical protein [Clostridia bacterium]